MSPTSRRLLGAALAAAVLAVFWPALGGGFFFIDDARYVAANPDVLAGLSPRAVAWALTTRACEYYHPLTWLSLLTDASLFGTGPSGFHFTALLLHALNAWLLFEVLLDWGCGAWPSAAAAALFALHPLRVETAAWISERKGVLCAFFVLVALRLYGRARRDRGRNLWPTALAFALAALSKPAALTLPLALLAVDACAYGRPARGRALAGLVAEKWPLWLIAAAAGAATMAAAAPNMAPPESIPPLARLGDPLLALWTQIAKAVAPRPMTVLDAPLGLIRVVEYTPLRFCALVAGAACAGLALRAARRLWPEGWGGALWLAALTVPILGFFRGAMTVVADRYTYLPHIGLAWAAAGLATRLVRARPRAGRPLAAAAVVGVAVCAVRARAELVLWTEPLARWEYAATLAPESAWARDELGVELLRAGRRGAAESSLLAATRLDPADARALNNLAVAAAEGGRAREAAALFARAEKLGGGPVAARNAAALRAPPTGPGPAFTLMTGSGPLPDAPAAAPTRD